MFFDYEFHALFILFAFILIKVRCNVDYESEAAQHNLANTTPSVDLRNLDMSIYCKFQPSGHVCNTTIGTSRRYYFDVHLKRCERFEYGHCNHSYNMFNGRHQCLDACRDKAYDEISANISEIVYCRYQPDFGNCNSYHPSWYYDIKDRLCKGFSYSGCGGNDNRFRTAIECRDVCGTALAY